MATNTSSQQQKANFVEHDEERVPETNGQDTGENGAKHANHDIQYHDELETIPEEEEDEDPQMAEKQDVYDLDTIAYTLMNLKKNHSIWPSMIPLKTQLLLWANQSLPHLSRMMYVFQQRR